MENDTQSRLIEIATQLFATKGFSGVSVREVTVAAQTNVSAISYHFNGKEGLYQAVLEEQFSPILQALEVVKNNDSLSPIERLTFYAERIGCIHVQRPYFARFMNSELANPTECGEPIIEKHMSKVYEFIHTALQEGITNGDFRGDLNAYYAAISLAGILNFYFIKKPLIEKITSLAEQDSSQYTVHAFRIFMIGILKTPPK